MRKQIYKNQTEDDYLICNYHQRHLIETENLKSKHFIFQHSKKLMEYILKTDLSYLMAFVS